jgi:hypothetical protein
MKTAQIIDMLGNLNNEQTERVLIAVLEIAQYETILNALHARFITEDDIDELKADL